MAVTRLVRYEFREWVEGNSLWCTRWDWDLIMHITNRWQHPHSCGCRVSMFTAQFVCVCVFDVRAVCLFAAKNQMTEFVNIAPQGDYVLDRDFCWRVTRFWFDWPLWFQCSSVVAREYNGRWSCVGNTAGGGRGGGGYSNKYSIMDLQIMVCVMWHVVPHLLLWRWGKHFCPIFGTYLVNQVMTLLNPWSQFRRPEEFRSHTSCWNMSLLKMDGQGLKDRKSVSSIWRCVIIHLTTSSKQFLRFSLASYSVYSGYSLDIVSSLQHHQHLRKLCNKHVCDAYLPLSTSYFHSQKHCRNQNSCRQ